MPRQSEMNTSHPRALPSKVRWAALIILAGAWIALLVAIYSMWTDERKGQGMRIALSFMMTVGVVALTLVWFTFFSRLSRRIRLATVAFIGIALVGVGLTVRIQEVTGGLTPKFRFVWQSLPDQQLERISTATDDAGVDLMTTTPDDFHQFLGPNRNAIINSITLETDWETHPPKEIWRQSIGAGWSSFAIVNGYAVTMEQRGEEELTTCYEVATGELKWANAITARHQTVLGGVGPRSTPVIHNGKVYTLGATGVLRCLDGANGEEVWSDDLLEKMSGSAETDGSGVAWGRSSSPLVVDDKLVVPVGGPLNGEKVSLIAFDLETGDEVWRAGDVQVSYSSPMLATLLGKRQILCVLQDFVCSFDPDSGELLWQHAWPGNSASNANVSQPVVISDSEVFLSKGYGHGCELIELSVDDQNDWQVTSIWNKFTLLKTKFTNVAIRDGYAYGLDDLILECVEVSSGRKMWKRGRYGFGQILLVDDMLLVQAESGKVALVEATPEKYNEVAIFQAIEGKTWNNPAIYGNYLLVRNGEEAACYELAIRQ